MDNTVSFNINKTVDTIRLLNSERRYIANGCYKIIEIYNSYSNDEWSGSKRKIFHEKLFGTSESKIEGYIGQILNMSITDTSLLNELLYSMASYIINITKADNNRTVNLTTNDFVNDNVTVNQVSLNITYSSISENIISTPGDNFENFKSSILSAFESGIRNQIDNFVTNLRRLPESVFDETTKEITKQASILNDLSLDYGTQIRILLDDISTFGTITKESLEKTVAANEQVTSKMNSEQKQYNTGDLSAFQ